MKVAALVLLILSACCFAQETAKVESKFYQLNFILREVEGDRVLNSRSYSLMMRNDHDRASIRAGEKLPVISGSVNGMHQFQQVNVGVNLDCGDLKDLGDHISVQIGANISSLVEPNGTAENRPADAPPVVRENLWQSYVTLPLKQPTIVYSSDDPASKRKMQLQVTVTPVR